MTFEPSQQRRCDRCKHYREFYDGAKLCFAGPMARTPSYARSEGSQCGPSGEQWQERPRDDH